MSMPLVTAAPSSTVRSISLPGTLKEMSTCVSSMLPDTTRRLPWSRWNQPDHKTPAATASTTTRRIGINILRFMFTLREHAPNRAQGGAQVDACDVVVVQRVDAVVTRALQPGLRVRYFDAVGDSGFVAPLRLREFVFRQLQAVFSSSHFGVGRVQILERQAHVQLYLIA